MSTVALLLGVQKTLGFLVLLILLFHYSFNHLELALPWHLLWWSFLDGFFGLRHVKDFKEVVDIEVVEIQRLQYDLTDHEIYVFWLQLYFLEEFEEIFLSDRVFCVSALEKSLVNVLLVMGDQLCDLNEHLIFTILLEQLILPNHFEEVLSNGLLFDGFELVYQHTFTWDCLILVAHLVDEDLEVAIG